MSNNEQYFGGIWKIGISRILALQVAKEIVTDLHCILARSALWWRKVQNGKQYNMGVMSSVF